jgi:hypothetical protein
VARQTPDSHTLLAMTGDPDWLVRALVASRHGFEARDRLLEDPDPRVRAVAGHGRDAL